MMGSAPRNGQENGSTATPKARVTAGDSSSQHSPVSARHEANARRRAGAAASRGQASRSSVASIAARASSTASKTAAKPSQD